MPEKPSKETPAGRPPKGTEAERPAEEAAPAPAPKSAPAVDRIVLREAGLLLSGLFGVAVLFIALRGGASLVAAIVRAGIASLAVGGLIHLWTLFLVTAPARGVTSADATDAAGGSTSSGPPPEGVVEMPGETRATGGRTRVERRREPRKKAA